MIDVPDNLMTQILRGYPIVAEVQAVEPGNRAWVKLSVAKNYLYFAGSPGPPPATQYCVLRFELPTAVLDDQGLHDSDYFVHKEFFKSEDLGEAVEKALTYELDWSKWKRLSDDPDCP